MNYQHLVQRPMLCSAACVQMCLLRRGHWHEQEEIAKGLGVTMIEKWRDQFPGLPVVPDDDPSSGFVFSQWEGARAFVHTLGYALEIVPHSEIEDLQALVRTAHENDEDVLFNFRWDPINGKEGGHYALIEGVEDAVAVCDPWWGSKPRWELPIAVALDAMSEKWDGIERGIVILKKTG